MKLSRWIFILLLLTTLLAVGCDNSSSEGVDGDDDTAGDTDTEDGSATIGPDGGEVSFEGVTVIIPEGALSEETEITIRSSDEGADGFEAVGPFFEFLPEGLEFGKDITVILPFNEELAGDRSLNGYWTAKGDDTTWENLGGELHEPARWRIQPDHFSHGVVGTTDPGDLPSIAFDRGDTWDVTFADDTSEDEGVQITVELTTTNIAAGVAVTLTVNGSELPAENVGADGSVEFDGVTLEMGENSLEAVADIEEGDDPSATASVTLSGCGLVFVDPASGHQLSDAGGDCLTDCGDDLDCNQPNLQYNVTVDVQNIGAGTEATLSVAGVDYNATVGANQVVFEGVSLPHGEQVTLEVSSESEGVTCEAEVVISVDISCDCHLEVTPIEDSFNLASGDDDPETEGFQKEFTATSDNCAPGATVAFNLDEDNPILVTLGDDQSAKAMLTLADGEHSLSVAIEEESGRTGAAGPYEFTVDVEAPAFEISYPADGAQLTKNDDIDLSLANGIQFTITGTASEATGELTLTINDEVWPETTIVDGMAFTFENVTITRPETRAAEPFDFTLTFSATDEAGNEGSSSIDIQAFFDEPEIAITQVNGTEVSDDIRLTIEHDADPDTDLLQTTLTAMTSLVLEGAVATLVVDGGVPMESSVGEDGSVAWEIELDYGQHELQASTTLAGGGEIILSDPVELWADWVAPDVGFVGLEDGGWINESSFDIQVFSNDAEEGQLVTLSLDGTQVGEAVALGADQVALFEAVQLPDYTEPTVFDLKADLADFAGNLGSKEISLTYDGFAPSVTVTVPNSPIEVNADITVTVAVPDETEGRMVSVKLYNRDDLDEAIHDDMLALAAGQVQQTYAFLADGSYRLIGSYEDEAGNIGTDQADFDVDTGCYTTSVFPLEGGTLIEGKYYFGLADATDGVVHIDISAEAVAPDPADDGETIQLFLDGSETPAATGTLVSGGYTFAAVALTEGEHTIEVGVLKDPGPQVCWASPRPIRIVVDFSTPSLALVDPTMPDPPTDPLTYDAQATDSADDPGFQTAFTFHSDDAGEGREVVLTVNNGTRTEAIYTQALDASGNAVFAAVTLLGEGWPENTETTLTAKVTNASGNESPPVVVKALVDRSLPSFRDITPQPGTLNASNDADPNVDGLQLEMSLFIDGGSPAPDSVTVSITADSDPENPYDIGPFELQASGRVDIATTLMEDGYTFNISHSDAFGNTGNTTIYYLVDFIATVTLRSDDGDLIEGESLEWNSDLDLQPGTEGFQTNFRANTFGLEEGSFVRLCSNEGRPDGEAPNGYCTYPDGASYVVVDKKRVTLTSGQLGVAAFSNVGLKDNVQHRIFVEADDEAGNYARSESARIKLDATVPDAPTITIQDDDAGIPNNQGLNIWLNAQEGTVSGSDLLVDILVETTADDAEQARLYRAGTLVDTVAVVSGEALFADVALPNGLQGQLAAEVLDDLENVSDQATSSVVVDIIAPEISFVGASPTAINLYQAQCGASGNADPCPASIQLLIEEGASEAFTLEGGKVDLSRPDARKYSAPTKDIPAYAGDSVNLTFSSFNIPQNAWTLTAEVSDPALNAATVTQDYFVDSLAPDIDLKTPAPGDFPVTYDENDDNLPGGCGGNGVADLLLTRCDYEVIAGDSVDIEEETTVELQYRLDGQTTWNTFDNGTWIADALRVGQSHAMAPIDFNRGTVFIRARATETSTSNVMTSSEYRVNADFDPGLYVQLARQDDTALVNNARFGYPDNASGYNTPYRTTIKILTNLADGAIPTLKLNGAAVPVSQATNGTGAVAGGEVTYSGIELSGDNAVEGSDTLEVTYTTPDPGSVTIGHGPLTVLSELARPEIDGTGDWGLSASYFYGASADNDGIPNGIWQFSDPGQVTLTMDETDIDRSLTVDLKRADTGAVVAVGTWSQAGTAVATFTTGNSNVELPNGAYYLYTDNVKDLYGNTILGIGQLYKPYAYVDDYPPGTITDLSACVGDAEDDAACSAPCALGDSNEECGDAGLAACGAGEHCDECQCITDLPSPAACGDGNADTGEECGEPYLCGDAEHCSSCKCVADLPDPAACGDGNADSGEECGEPGLSCAGGESCVDCRCTGTLSGSCGNGSVDANEECGEPSGCSAGQLCIGCKCMNDLPKCGSDACDRRAGRLLLTWTAPDKDVNNGGVGQSGEPVEEYEFKYVATTGSTPCNGASWSSATALPTGNVTVSLRTPLAAVGSAQSAEISGLTVNTNTSYCFFMRAKDRTHPSSFNYTSANVAREVTLEKTSLGTSQGAGQGNFGLAVEFGDFNNDGKADLAVGDFSSGDNFDGEVYVYEGSTSPSGDNGGLIYGKMEASLGVSLATGDVNGDGVDDLVVGAFFANGWMGEAYVYFGDETDGLNLCGDGQVGAGEDCEVDGDCAGGEHCAHCKCVADLPAATCDGGSADAGEECGDTGTAGCAYNQHCVECKCVDHIPADVTFTTGEYESLGAHIEVFDWDGDSIDDIFISTSYYSAAKFPVYLMKGRSSWNASYTPSASADLTIKRDNTGNDFAYYMGHGDIDGDSWIDLLIADNNYNVSGDDRFFVLWGDSTLTGTIWAEDSGSAIGAEFSAVANQESEGANDDIVGLPDTNGDGLADILAHRSTSSAAVLYNSSLEDLQTVAYRRAFNESGDANFGWFPKPAGDFNLDGYNDAVISGDGLVRIYWGNVFNLSPLSAYVLEIAGLPTGANTLQAIGNGDFNGDGRDDIVVINRDSGDLWLIY